MDAKSEGSTTPIKPLSFRFPLVNTVTTEAVPLPDPDPDPDPAPSGEGIIKRLMGYCH